MYNLIECIDIYSKRSERLWKYCKEIPAVNNAGILLILMVLMLLIHLTLKQKLQVKLMVME